MAKHQNEVACPDCGGSLDDTAELEVQNPEDDYFCPRCGGLFMEGDL